MPGDSGVARDPDAQAPGRDRRATAPGARLALDDLSTQAASTESGIAFIYGLLDTLVDRFALDDAALVLDEAGIGRQVFRAGRRPIDDAHESLLAAAPGFHTVPPVDDTQLDQGIAVASCVLALRLDLLRYDAWHDPLTGLYNRRSFDRLLEMAVARSSRYGWPFALVMLDLDDFKALNDREGHLAGDAALRDLGGRMRHALRFGDNAARIGGDEFAMILPNTDPELVPALLDRVCKAEGFASPCPSFSFGVAQCPRETDDMETLIRIADQRLYGVKGARTR